MFRIVIIVMYLSQINVFFFLVVRLLVLIFALNINIHDVYGIGALALFVLVSFSGYVC